MHVKKRVSLILAGMSLVIPVLANSATPPSKPALIVEQAREWQIPYKPVDIVQSVDGNYIFVLTDNNRILIYEPTGNLKGSFPVDPGVTAIETDARGEAIMLIDGANNRFSMLAIDFVVSVNTAGSPFKGKSDAPVTIAVFTDFE